MVFLNDEAAEINNGQLSQKRHLLASSTGAGRALHCICTHNSCLGQELWAEGCI